MNGGSGLGHGSHQMMEIVDEDTNPNYFENEEEQINENND